MNVLELVIATFGGFLLGLFYFGGLWWTVRRAASSQAKVPLLLGSFVIRGGVIATGFVFIMDGRWERMLACVFGFLVARTLLIYWLGGEHEHQRPQPG